MGVYDRQVAGSMDIADLPDALRSGGLRLTNAQCEQLKKEAEGGDSDAKLSFDGFKKFFLKANELSIRDNEIEDALSYFSDKDGKIDLAKFKHTLMTLGDAMSVDEIDTIMKDCNVDIDESSGSTQEVNSTQLLELIQK